MIRWKWSKFEELSTQELYEIMAVRQEVFVVGQQILYQDADGKDQNSWHLCGYEKDDTGEEKLVAYLRVVFPGEKYKEPAIGRVLTVPSARGKGYGKVLMKEAIKNLEREYPHLGIRMSAQAYLTEFYERLGFKVVSEPYIEEDIEHVEMVKEAIASAA